MLALAACVHTPPLRSDLAPPAGSARDGTQLTAELAGGVSRSFDDQQARIAGDLAIAIAPPRPFGWHGALTARYANTHYAIALRPLGVAVRFGGAALGVSAGAAVLTGLTGGQLGGAAGLWYEQPLGPVQLGIRADYEHAFKASEHNAGWLVGSLRFGGDRGYWRHGRAGVGPVVSAGYECAFADICSLVALAGLELYGAD